MKTKRDNFELIQKVPKRFSKFSYNSMSMNRINFKQLRCKGSKTKWATKKNENDYRHMEFKKCW